jgi:hypothetical protein
MRSVLLFLAVSMSLNASDTTPTFTRDILPILQARCQNCHRPGEIGPMPLLTYQQAKPWAASIKEAVLTRKMPPWFSVTPNQKFHNDPTLSVAEKEKIANWASHGTPEGDPKDARPNPAFGTGWNIGEPDQIFTPAKPFEVPATGTVDYTYYIIPAAFDHDVWLAATEFRPQNPAVVHHGELFIRPPESKWLRDYPAREYFVPKEQRPKPGAPQTVATSAAGSTISEEALILYVPGYIPEPFPDGVALFVAAGSDLVFQLHYTPNGKNASDLPSVGVRFAKAAPPNKITRIGIANSTFAIPPGASNYAVQAKRTLGADCDLYAVYPHMHLRGKSMLLKATYPDGTSEVLLDVPTYDFKWQQKFNFAAPKHLPAGTVVEVIATFDNSANNPYNPAPDKEVRWGDQTYEEMMIGFLDVSIPSTLDKKLLYKAAAKPASAP